MEPSNYLKNNYLVNYNGETMTSSRRKLALKTQPGDLSKALILYQPFPGKLSFGRNLALSTDPVKECKPDIQQLETQCETKTKKQYKQTCDKSDPKKLSPGNRFSLGFVVVAVVIFSLISSIIRDDDICESSNSMTIDLKLLSSELKTNLFGQELAVTTIANVLEEFQVTVEQLTVLVLLGGSGTGKTWTNHLIGNSLPEHANQATLHLGPWSSSQEIERAFKSLECCRWNFFFIEDSDYADNQQIETVLDWAVYVNQNISCSHRKIVVILTSNYGQKEFAELLLQERENSGTRWTMNLVNLQEAASKLTSPLINAFAQRRLHFTPVPYLPLEKMQLEQCIRQDLMFKKKSASVDVINKITQHFQFVPPQKKYFVTSGCKTVSTFVNLYS